MHTHLLFSIVIAYFSLFIPLSPGFAGDGDPPRLWCGRESILSDNAQFYEIRVYLGRWNTVGSDLAIWPPPRSGE